MATDFKKVTSNEELQDGANYILVAVAKYSGVTSNYVMKDGFTSLDTNQNSGAIVATATNDVITLPDGAVTVTIKAVEDKYRLYYNGSTVQGYISANTGAKNKLRISNSESDYELMTINVGTTEVDIQSVSYFTSGTTNYSKLSFAAGSKTTGNFNFYTSTYNTSKIFLYREVEPTDVASIAEYNALDLGTIVRFGCPLTISYANRDNIFAQDADGNGIFMYSKNGIGAAANGKVIPANELIGKVASYNSNKQLNFTDYTLPALTDGDAINPITVQFGALNDSYLYKYVMIPDVTLTKGADVMLYNVNGVTGFLANEYGLKNWPTLIDGKTFNIYGIYVNMGDSKGLYFIDAKEVGATLDSPTLSVEGGTYNTEKTVNITAADGAEVRYTTNDAADIKYGVAGTDYTVGNSVTIDKSCTLRVIAVKGEEFSEVVSAIYTMKTATPTITAAEAVDGVYGNEEGKLEVTISCPKYSDNVIVRYSVNGVEDIFEGNSKVITINKTATIKATALYGAFDESDEATATFTWNNPNVIENATVTGDIVIADQDAEKFIASGSRMGKGKEYILTDIFGTEFTIKTVSLGSNGTLYPGRFSSNGSQLRMNNVGDVVSITSTYPINSVTLTADAAFKINDTEIEAVNGTYTWTKNQSAEDVYSFTITSTGAKTNISKIAINYTGRFDYYKVNDGAALIGMEKGKFYQVNVNLQGVKANDGVLYARTSEPSAKPSEPNKDYFDKSYEDYDLSKYIQRDWVVINGLTSDYEGKEVATGFIASYDGEALTPVATAPAVVGSEVDVTNINTFSVANVFYGNYENTESLFSDGYKPFFVKAKVNEVANYAGTLSKDSASEGSAYRLTGSGKCGVFEGKGVLLEPASEEIRAALDAKLGQYQIIEGVLLTETSNTLANGDVKIVALAGPADAPTGVAALKADGKATVYGTEGAVVVNGADGKVMIFDAMGRMVKSVSAEGAATVAMPAGYYIVRTAGTAAKVMVK